jgi:hypothetical protein
MLGNSWVAAQLAASQEGLGSMELGTVQNPRILDSRIFSTDETSVRKNIIMETGHAVA